MMSGVFASTIIPVPMPMPVAVGSGGGSEVGIPFLVVYFGVCALVMVVVLIYCGIRYRQFMNAPEDYVMIALLASMIAIAWPLSMTVGLGVLILKIVRFAARRKNE